MKVLKAKVNWMEGWANDPYFQILVDKEPKYSELIWKVKQLNENETFYYGEEDGYAYFLLHDSRNERGFGGSTYTLKMFDGSTRMIKGPWSSNEVFASTIFEKPIIHA